VYTLSAIETKTNEEDGEQEHLDGRLHVKGGVGVSVSSGLGPRMRRGTAAHRRRGESAVHSDRVGVVVEVGFVLGHGNDSLRSSLAIMPIHHSGF